MTINYEALKLCPIYKRNEIDYCNKVVCMTICDTHNFFSAKLYIATYDVKGDQLSYYCRSVLTSDDFAIWLKQYGIELCLSHTSIAKIEHCSINKYAVSIEGRKLEIFVEAYSAAQAEHDAAKVLGLLFPYAADLIYKARRV